MSAMDKYALHMRSGRVMAAVGLGTLAPKESEEDVIAAVKSAVRAGYRHIDCAAIYRNERAVGHAIKQLIVEGIVRREDLFITSKLWNTCHRADLVRPSLRKSLEDLGLKYLDLYLMHWPVAYREGGDFHPWDGDTGKVLYSDVDYLETWKALEDCVDEGLTHDIGMSNFNSKQLQRILSEARIKPSMNQIEVNCRNTNRKLIEFCQSQGVPVVGFAPLGTPNNSPSDKKVSLLDEPVVKEIASTKNRSPAQVCLRFVLQLGIGVVPKSVNAARIAQNIQIFDFDLSDEEMQKLSALNINYRTYAEDIALEHKYYPFHEEF
ncbi:1,5-anhydro-D-fructose reductase-like [Haliotis rufescens]|uniref:1,5-anhydro-D-fructose reductase-like n=1 Tax=Haliotis rufescens TaxID=6454 RepID=UPI00201F7541|nr:1,5-anhydro-D-fructose reductase-like [Haliotis rufescens]